MAWLARRNRGERWKKLVATRLLNRLSLGTAAWAYFSSLGLALLGLAGLIFAMAEPESGEEWITVESEGRNILFCIDISRSMLAEDIQPSRLKAARAAGLEILERFPNDRVGVLLYAGANLIQCPLTLDHGFVEQTLAQLTPADIPYGGSNLSGAINDGVTLLTQSGQQSNVMVVFSDGENSTSGVETAAANAASEGIFIYALGMGTTAGSFIPDQRLRDGKFRDRNGNQVFSKLNEEALQLIASRTDGFYSRGIGGDFLRKLDSALEEMDRFQEEGKHQRVAKPAHQWFLLGGLLLLMISIFVRTLPLRSAVTAFVCFLSFSQADASLINDGKEALERGDQVEAHQHFRLAAKEESGERSARLHLAAGSAAFQAQHWEAAADSFSEALVSDEPSIQQQAHYSLATSLFYLGAAKEKEKQKQAWRGAVKHYEAALALDRNDHKSAENLKQVQAYLDQKEETQKQPEDNQDQKNQDQENQDQKSDEQDQDQDQNSQPPKSEEEKNKNQEEQNPDKQPSEKEKEEDRPSEKEDDQREDQNAQNKSDQNDEKEQAPPSQEQEQNQKGSGAEQDPKSHKGNGEESEKPAENAQEDPRSNQNSNSTPREASDQEPQQKTDENANPQEAQNQARDKDPVSLNETREQRARRLLKQYADSGGKAPRRVRRPYNRSAQDW